MDHITSTNPFEHTRSVAIELSNQCSYAPLHPRCPAHYVKEPITLPVSTAETVIETLGRYEYSGELAFHLYNEPLEDPRLFYLLNFAIEACPFADPYVVTNGGRLTEVMLRELQDYGAKVLVTPYKPEVRDRIVPWVRNGDVSTMNVGLDSRLGIYDGLYVDLDLPCLAPLNQVIITCDRQVGLCCMDHARKHTLGPADRLAEVLLGDKANGIYQALSQGHRGILDICRRCQWTR